MFARCALTPLASIGTSGSLNATILLRLADDHPPAHCGELIRDLAGTLRLEAVIARATLRDALAGTDWPGVAQGSRAVRGLSAQTRRLAHDPIARHACQPRHLVM
jgi:hypothetical protein